MTNIKNYKTLVGIFLIVVVIGTALIIVHLYSITEKFNNESMKENTTNENMYENYTEANVKTPEEAKKWIKEAKKRKNITFTSSETSTLENVPLTSKPAFKVDEKYMYKIKTPASPMRPIEYAKSGIIIEDYIYYNVTFSVDKIERINKSDFYVLITEGSGKVIMGYAYREGKASTLSTTPIPTLKWYINTENGKKFNEEMEEITDYYSSISAMQLSKTYISWMLKLSDGLKWTIKKEEKSTGLAGCESTPKGIKCKLIDNKYRESVKEQSYEVEGIEKINGRKCFKVNVREKSCKNEEGCKVLKRMIYWVDVEKRITVKYQQWYEGLLVVEIELIDYQK
ncbi:MAG: hypothetical protein COY41_04965 [Candidatus Altarchaeum sp. CG_4_10_14_0_8_um_filter_32_851]|nr:MAG: hypothetical protein COY41_04965 [Candidatus Altarchaeum sp. CG_4_10_14_0_8_um_filter_32_851]